MNTKDKILREALRLFSEKGFAAVSVRTIAKAVRIKESSLYNHFSGKEDIFTSIIAEYNARGEAFFSNLNLTGEDMQFTVDQKTIDTYKNMSAQQFFEMANQIFDFYFTDEINTQMRKMLTMEQYRNRELAEMYRFISFDASLEYQTRLCEAMMDAKCFIKADPYIVALHFFAPIFLIFYKFDNDEASLAEARELFLRHIAHFRETYTIKDV
jgi:AcrR family transcriptional regulator